jgi:hypothetical protein
VLGRGRVGTFFVPSAILVPISSACSGDRAVRLPGWGSRCRTCQQRTVALLVEDNPDDLVMVREAFAQSLTPVQFCVVSNGEQAITFVPWRRLQRPTRNAAMPRPSWLAMKAAGTVTRICSACVRQTHALSPRESASFTSA